MVSGPRGQGGREPRPNALDNYYGWNSSMGRDVRVDPSLPPQFQYRNQGRTVVSGNEPAFTDMGRNRNVPFNVPFDDSRREQAIMNQYRTFNDSRREQAIMNQYQRPTKQHPNPRMRGMMGGLGGLQEQAAVDPSDWRTILRILEAGGDPGTETQTAQMGGYGYNPAPKSYDDIYKGTDIIDMEVLPGAGYDPREEYEFDYKRDKFKDLLPGTWPQYAAHGGLMSLRR
jgi:hypothetical protein